MRTETNPRLLVPWLLTGWLLTVSVAFASYHTFRIEQIYSNASGTVQFIVMRESMNVNGESQWTDNALTSTHANTTAMYPFPKDLPGEMDDGYGMMVQSPTANRRVLIATPGFAALGLVTPDYVMPTGFLATAGGTVNYAAVDQVTYPSLPTDGIHAIDRNGAVIQGIATNFAGQSAAVTAVTAPSLVTPAVGLWWNPNESGTGYNMDVKHGVLVVTVFTYDAAGNSEWYLASGPLVLSDAGTAFSATLDNYRNGQCVGIGCLYKNPGPPAGNDGIISITFTSATSATVTLPGRATSIQPQAF